MSKPKRLWICFKDETCEEIFWGQYDNPAPACTWNCEGSCEARDYQPCDAKLYDLTEVKDEH